MPEQELRDAIVILPTLVQSAFSSEPRSQVGTEQAIRNVTHWAEIDGSLMLFRKDTEVARFKEWIGIRLRGID